MAANMVFLALGCVGKLKELYCLVFILFVVIVFCFCFSSECDTHAF